MNKNDETLTLQNYICGVMFKDITRYYCKYSENFLNEELNKNGWNYFHHGEILGKYLFSSWGI